MRKLLTSRLFRCTLCLILVCCMIVNCLAIKAEASVLGGTALALFGDDAIALIAACLAGLGVMAKLETEMDTLTFRHLCQDAYDAMAAAGEWVVDGAVTVYNCATELWDYGVDCGMVQWLHDWLFDSGTVSSSTSVTHSFSIGGEARTAISNIPCELVVFWRTGYDYYAGCTLTAYAPITDGTSSLSVTYRDNTYYAQTFNGYYVVTVAQTSGTVYANSCWDTSLPVIHDNTACRSADEVYQKYFSGEVFPPSISTSLDVSLGTIAPPGSNIETEYGEYIVIVAPNGVPDTGGDGSGDDQPQIPIIPVPVLPSYEETIQLPQEDIWKGNKVETEDPDTGGSTDPSTGTDTDDPDSGSNDPTTPTTGTDTDPDTQPDSPGAPSTDIGDYQIDLKEFFPFCIPFDLYDFFTCLNADPVAPVIEWVIPLPGGDTYPLEINLSAFDGVAQLLRRLQLLLFCVGLAFKTRDLIKG